MTQNLLKQTSRGLWILVALFSGCSMCGSDIPYWEVGETSDTEVMCRCEIKMPSFACDLARSMVSDDITCKTQVDQPICIPTRLVDSKLSKKAYEAEIEKLCSDDYKQFLLALTAELDFKDREKGCEDFHNAQNFVGVRCYPTPHREAVDGKRATVRAEACLGKQCDRIACTAKTCKRVTSKPEPDTAEVDLTPCSCTAPSGCGISGFICTGTASETASTSSPLISLSPIFSTVNAPITIELWPAGSYIDIVAHHEGKTGAARTKLTGRIQLYGHCQTGERCVRKLEGHVFIDDFSLNFGKEKVHVEGGALVLRTDRDGGVIFSPTGEGIIPKGKLLASGAAYIDAPTGMWDRERSRYYSEVRNEKQILDIGIDLDLGIFSLRDIGFQAEHGQATIRLTGFISNQPPTAVVTGQQLYEATGSEGATISLSGIESMKPRARTLEEFLPREALFYSWWIDEPFYGTLISHSPELAYKSPLGRTTYYLVVRDLSGAISVASVDVEVKDTTPPGLNCPGGIVVEATSTKGASVPYQVTVSDLVSTPIVQYSHFPGDWFPVGTTVVEVSATDAAGNNSRCSFPVRVKDTTPPSLSVKLRQDCLWPPLTDMALFEIGRDIIVVANDIVDPSPKIRISRVESSQFERELFPISPDIVFGDSAMCIRIENERSILEPPRKYYAEIEAKDASGNLSKETVTIDVPFLWKGCDQFSLNTRRFVSKNDPRCSAP